MKRIFLAICAFLLVSTLILPGISMAQTPAMPIDEAENTQPLDPINLDTEVPIPLEEDASLDIEMDEFDSTNNPDVEQILPELIEETEDSSAGEEEPLEEEEVIIPETVEDYFTDVPTDAYYYDQLLHAIKNGYMTYNENREFKGNTIVSRMDVVHLLIQVNDLDVEATTSYPTFTDIEATDPNMPYIATVVNAGLMKGDTTNRFNPDQSLTRAELAMVLKNAYQLETSKATNFHDIKENAWYEEAVRALLTNGITAGSGNYQFNPNGTLTRAELITFLVRASTENFRLEPLEIPIAKTVEAYYTDVTKSTYYYEHLLQAIKKGYMTYDENRQFNGNQTVTRMDVVHLLIEVNDLDVEATTTYPTFTDVKATDPKMPYIATVVNAGLMKGDPTHRFNPSQSLTRAELAVVLKNAFQLKATKATNFHDVKENAWYEEAVRALLTTGVTAGYSNYKFKPEETLNRAELITFFVRASDKNYRIKPVQIPKKSCAHTTTKTTYRVNVAVTNMWEKYNNSRPVDRPAMTNPVDYNKWISSMTLSQKKWLVDRVDTQALYNDEVKILEQRGNMYKIAAVDQWVPYNRSGYPGWVPKAHVTKTNIDTSDCQIAIVTAKKAPILNTDTTHYLTVSYSTILPVLEVVDNWVVVQTPNAGRKVIDRKHVKVHDSYEAIKKPTRSEIVNEAKRFLDLKYLWAGTSAWGYDCSGILYAVYRNHGIMIPRDSFYQAIRGKAVAKKDLKPGDLVFFASNGGKGKVYHVGMYLSPGKMLHAPNYASKVKIESFEQGAYKRNYAGARNYLD